MPNSISRIKNEHEFDTYIADNLNDIYKLKQYFESNSVHDETVYVHTKTVFFNMLNLLSIYKVNQSEILLNAAIFHDVGKCMVLKTFKDGSTTARHHELYSALTIPVDIIQKFKISDLQNFIYLIKDHSDLHCLLDDRVNWEKYIDLYRQRFPEIYRNLLLLSLADIMNSHLQTSDLQEYNFRVDSLTKLLKVEFK